MISNVSEYFNTLDTRFQPAQAAGLDLVFQWNLTGDDGGVWHAVVKDGAMALHQGEHSTPSVQITISTDNYVKLINGKLKGPMAVMTRKLKVKGNVMMAKKMDEIFPR
jgi:putative sterol carrier protein